MKKLIRTFKQISILILAITFIGCEDDDAVLPKVVAGFTHTINADNGVVTFINISEHATNYSWDFGDESNATLINPVNVYSNGTYRIVLTASNVAGASATFQDEITILIPEIATIPITFDGENTKYEAEVFGGASFDVVANPDPTGANTSTSKVGAITNVGAQYEGFYIDLGSPIDLTENQTIKVLFWSNTAIDVLLKLEEGGTPAEATASHVGTGWEAIYFTFDSDASYSRFTMFVDGPGTTSGTFYIDEISQIPTADIPCLETNLALPIDFDCAGTDYASKDSGDVAFEVIDNPELSGINATPSKVAKLVFDSNQQWENMKLTLDTPIDFSIDKTIKLKFFSADARALKLKLEGGGTPVETDVNHTGSGWEELTFDMNTSDSFTNLVLFVDGGADTVGTFYVDDLTQVASTGGGTGCTETMLALPIDFDCEGTDYVAKDSGDVAFEVIDNPELSGINAIPSKVAKLVFDSNQQWENMNLTLDTPIDFSTDKFIKLKFFSTDARTLKLKFEGGGAPPETDVNHTGSGWEELSFEMNTSGSFTNLILFVDGGADTAGTFYVDDLMQASSGGSTECTETMLALPIDFDCEGTDYVAKDSGDVAFEVIDNPELSGINATPSKVAKLVFDSNQQWENMNLTLDTPIDFSTDKTIKLKFFSADSRTLKLKFEGGGAPPETDVNHTGSGWEELSFDMNSSDSFTNLILFVDGGTDTAGTFYVDDLMQVASEVDPGCTIDPPTGELLANGGFEANSGDGACWQFNLGGGTAAVSTELANTGTYSAKLTTGANQAPNIKMERFASSIAGGVTVQVSFKYRFTTALGTGSILQVLAFSELSAGAVEHNLGNAPDTPLDTWNTYTNTFVTDAAIAGNISLLLQLTGSGNIDGAGVVYIDDIQVTQL